MNSQNRIYFLDNLKSFLTILVVLFHVAVTYGPIGSWYFYDRNAGFLTNLLLGLFVIINQFYFMGLFFFISGYFTPGSYNKKGRKRFILDRLMRLGIPLIIYTLFLSPLVGLIASRGSANYLQLFLGNLKSLDTGPLWFIEALLLFNGFYCLLRYWNRKIILCEGSRIRDTGILFLILALSIVTFLVMLFLPFGSTFAGFQLAFFPQYILFFALGIFAYNNNWLASFHEKLSTKWIFVGLISIIATPVIIFINGEANFNKIEGGFYPQAFIGAFFSSVISISMLLFLMRVCKKYFNQNTSLEKFLSKNAFTTYVIHPVIIVSLSVLLYSISIPSSVKFVLVATFGIIFCFIASFLWNVCIEKIFKSLPMKY